MTTQAGAYYDPAAKAFFVVMVPSSDLMLDTMSAHELTHALQDQHFDLERFLRIATVWDTAADARQFAAAYAASLAARFPAPVRSPPGSRGPTAAGCSFASSAIACSASKSPTTPR